VLAIPLVARVVEVPVQPAVVVPPIEVEHVVIRVRFVSAIVYTTISRAAYFSCETETLSAT